MYMYYQMNCLYVCVEDTRVVFCNIKTTNQIVTGNLIFLVGTRSSGLILLRSLNIFGTGVSFFPQVFLKYHFVPSDALSART